jgi:hypothetical protein
MLQNSHFRKGDIDFTKNTYNQLKITTYFVTLQKL